MATMTSSGKSLCYNVPVLEELLKDPSSCALYLFPTKVGECLMCCLLFPSQQTFPMVWLDWLLELLKHWVTKIYVDLFLSAHLCMLIFA